MLYLELTMLDLIVRFDLWIHWIDNSRDTSALTYNIPVELSLLSLSVSLVLHKRYIFNEEDYVNSMKQ